MFLDPGVAFLMTTNAADLTGGQTGSVLIALQLRLDSFRSTGR
jgi:hypothetical protein